MNNNIVFLADAFGYGPITTLCLIAEQIKKNVNNKLVFVGPKMCVEYATKLQIFDEFIDGEYTEENIEKNISIFKNAYKIIAVETTDILIYLINKYQLHNLYLVDNLFWMWDTLEPELKKLKKYYISNVINCKKNKERIAQDFDNIVEVGGLRQYDKFRCVKSNNLLISLGGVESYMINDSIVFDYYLNSIKIILNNKMIKKFDKIIIAGGTDIINYLKKNISKKNVQLSTFDNKEYLDVLYNSSYVIASPGLGNFNEIVSTDIKCLFLLPINYSQYLQKKFFLSLNIGFFSQNNINETKIEEYLCEEEGVKKVIYNLHQYQFDNFDKELTNFFVNKNNDNNRKKYYINLDKNGIEDICNDIFMR